MDYRQRKYQRQQRNARLRVKEQLYKTSNIKPSSMRLKFQEDDELPSGVEQPSQEDLTEREMARKDNT